MILGAHCSTAGGVHRALERADAIGALSCQIFVKNNMQWLGRPFTQPQIDQFNRGRAVSNCRIVFGHAGYLINIAASVSANRERSIQSLIQELELAAQLGLPFLVLHPGAHLGAGEEAGLNQAARALDAVFRATRSLSVRVALENTAGQGTCLGSALYHIAEIYRRVRHPERLGVCLDTAHFFAAGYDIRSVAGWDAVIREVGRSVGLDQVLAFHLNDSRTDLESRVDRHAGIGQGRIGREAFAHIVNDRRFSSHPGCLETPKSADLHEDVENLTVLRSLAKPGARKGCRGVSGRNRSVKARVRP